MGESTGLAVENTDVFDTISASEELVGSLGEVGWPGVMVPTMLASILRPLWAVPYLHHVIDPPDNSVKVHPIVQVGKLRLRNLANKWQD